MQKSVNLRQFMFVFYAFFLALLALFRQLNLPAPIFSSKTNIATKEN